MKLYEISEKFRSLFDDLDNLCEINDEYPHDGLSDARQQDAAAQLFKEGVMQAWFDTLDCVEEEFKVKAENVAAYIKSLKAEAAQLKAEEDALKARREQKKRKIEYLSQYLLDSMQTVHLTKIDMPKAKISLRNNAESVAVDDEKSFIKWAQENNDELLRYKMPEIKKTDVKKLLQSGANIPCVRLVRTQSLIIK